MDSGWSMNGVPIPLDDCYTTTVTHLRIFDEGDGWALDGADDDGRWTYDLWKYDTHAEAVSQMRQFMAHLIKEGYTLAPRKRDKGDR